MLELHFKLDRETKGTFVYAETNEDGSPKDRAQAAIGVLYLRKGAEHAGSERIKVTVEAT